MVLRALAAAFAIAASATACSRASPEAAVRALATAAHEGDRVEVESLLGPRTRERLAADARLATEQAGRRRLTASDLLAAGWAAATDELEDARVMELAGDRAVVELVGRRGARERVEVVRVNGAWLVELP